MEDPAGKELIGPQHAPRYQQTGTPFYRNTETPITKVTESVSVPRTFHVAALAEEMVEQFLCSAPDVPASWPDASESHLDRRLRFGFSCLGGTMVR